MMQDLAVKVGVAHFVGYSQNERQAEQGLSSI